MVASSLNNEQSPVTGEQTPVRVCDAVAEETEKQLAAYRREKEKFGKHPLWRRLTGLTFDYEAQVTAKQRKWGLRQLVKWIKGRASDERRTSNEDEGRRANDLGVQRVDAEDACGPLTANPSPAGTEAGATGRGGPERRVSLAASWEREPEQWARAKHCGTQLEEICRALEISGARLSALTRECCGVSASELIDGFKIERVRKGMFEKLREAARELWGVPGYMVYEKLGPHGRTAVGRMQEAGGRSNGTGNNVKTEDAENVDGECKVAPSPRVRFAHVGPLPRGGAGNRSGERDARDTNEGRGENGTQSGRIAPQTKRPQYFRVRNAEWRTEDEIEERERRTKELLKRLRAECNLEVMALELGFANGSRMKRACLNVLGKTWRAIERGLVEDVVRYYLCAEDKLLRELASGEDSILSFCARELYCGTEEKPEPPFLDEWSGHERFDREWLEWMAGAFG